MAKLAAWKKALQEAGPVRRSKAEQEAFYNKAFQIVKDRWRAQGKIRNAGDLSRRVPPGSKYSEEDLYWNAFDKEVEAELKKFPGVWLGSPLEEQELKEKFYNDFRAGERAKFKNREAIILPKQAPAFKRWIRYASDELVPVDALEPLDESIQEDRQFREGEKVLWNHQKAKIVAMGETRPFYRWIRLDGQHKDENELIVHVNELTPLKEATNTSYIAYSESDRAELEAGLKKILPWAQVIRQTLGGEHRASLAARVSADPKESWSNGIFQNSRYAIFSIDNGKIEKIAGDRSWQMRKSNVANVTQMVTRINGAQPVAGDLKEASVPYGIQKQAAQAFINGLPPELRKNLRLFSNEPGDIITAVLNAAFNNFEVPNATELKKLGKMLRMVRQLGIEYDHDAIPAKYRSAVFESKESQMPTQKKSNILDLINEAAVVPSPVTAYFQYLIKYDPTRGFEVLSGQKHIAWARSLADAKKYVDDNLPKDKVFGSSGSYSTFKEGKVIKEDIHETVIAEGTEYEVDVTVTMKPGSPYKGGTENFVINAGSSKQALATAIERTKKLPKYRGASAGADNTWVKSIDADVVNVFESSDAEWREFHGKVAPGTPYRSFHKYVPGPQELCIAKLENGKPCNGSKGSVVHKEGSK